jgi:hypothetical protein
MTPHVLAELFDDLDGASAEETVRFGLDGTTYEVDLAAWQAASLREALSVFVSRARPLSSRPTRAGRDVVTPAVLRAWARDNGLDVSARGQVPARIREAYDEASLTSWR